MYFRYLLSSSHKWLFNYYVALFLIPQDTPLPSVVTTLGSLQSGFYVTMLNFLDLVKYLEIRWTLMFSRLLGFLFLFMISDAAADCSYVIARLAIAAPPGHHL